MVAGINGDFFNTSNGLPIGILVSDGKLLSSDGGYYAIGFREDGSAVIGKPGLSVTADLGYQLADSTGYASEVIRTIAGVNKARVSTGGIYLYTYDFNDRHTTGNTEAGVDVLCTIVDGSLAIGATLTLRVEQVIEATSATAIGPDQVVLSANALSSTYHTDALRNIPAGAEITLTITAADEDWNDVVYACGALYSLVEDGSVVSGLPSGQNPRTAVGVKRGRHRRLLHHRRPALRPLHRRHPHPGGPAAHRAGLRGRRRPGRRRLHHPDRHAAGRHRRRHRQPPLRRQRADGDQPPVPGGRQRALRPSGPLLCPGGLRLRPGRQQGGDLRRRRGHQLHPHGGGTIDLDASAGELDGSILTTPARGGDITVTASHGRQEGSTAVHAIADPTDVAIRNASGTALTSLSTTLGAVTQLTATAAWNHISLKADAEAFTWEVDGKIGTIDENGNFTATAPGTGTITVSAGRPERHPRHRLRHRVLRRRHGGGGLRGLHHHLPGLRQQLDFSLNHTADTVRMGRGSARVDYTLTETGASQGLTPPSGGPPGAPASTPAPTRRCTCGSTATAPAIRSPCSAASGTGASGSLVTTLDFTGWKQVTVSLAAGSL